MKTTEETSIKADPVMTEVRRAKVALARKYDFDVVAMVRGLRERDEMEKAKAAEPTADRATSSAERGSDR